MSFDTTNRPSTPALFADALAQMTSLIETELRLVKTEVSEKLAMAIRALVVMLFAAVLMLAGVFIILFGIVQLAIFFGLVAWQAYFLVGFGFLVIGGIALLVAARSVSVDNLMPKRTISQLGKDADIVKEQVK